MITKIRKGSRAIGLVNYLLGPGKHEEHVNPTVIGSWDDQPGRFAGMSAGEIGRLLEAPLAIQDVAPGNLVWHTSLRNHADDRILSNDEWVEVARDVLDRTGIAPRGDDGAARWIVVRHDEDHVHLAAVLARQDTGAKIFPRRDYVRAREACAAAEDRLGLARTNREGHGRPGRSRPEEERVRAEGADLRLRLRRAAEVAAAGSTDGDEYLDQLQAQGVMVATRTDENGTITGYRVAVPGDGEPVWFGGSKLHRSLSWPQLERHWQQPSSPGRPTIDGEQLVEEMERIAQQTRIEDLDGTDIPEAAGAVLRSAAHLLDGGHDTELNRAVDEFRRATTETRTAPRRATNTGLDLRTIAIALMLGNHRRDTATRIIMSGLLLIEATAQLRQMQDRLAQAQAAHAAAQRIAGVSAFSTTTTTAPKTPPRPGGQRPVRPPSTSRSTRLRQPPPRPGPRT